MKLWAQFVFDPGLPAVRSILSALCGLPHDFRPIRHSFGEDDVGMPIDDVSLFLDSIEEGPMPSFLRGKRGIMYDIKGGEDALPVKCSCFLNTDPAPAKLLVVHMARTAPLFGNLCVEDEMLHRNRIFTKLYFGTCESWVGRDIRKYLPGLYWLTVISETLADQHGVPLSKVGTAALDEVVFENGRHLFRFYDHPDQWRQHRRAMDALCSALPGVFSIDGLPARATGPITYPELLKIREPWR